MGETYMYKRGENIHHIGSSSKERWILLFCSKWLPFFKKRMKELGLLELPMTTDQTIDELVQLG